MASSRAVTFSTFKSSWLLKKLSVKIQYVWNTGKLTFLHLSAFHSCEGMNPVRPLVIVIVSLGEKSIFVQAKPQSSQPCLWRGQSPKAPPWQYLSFPLPTFKSQHCCSVATQTPWFGPSLKERAEREGSRVEKKADCQNNPQEGHS